MKNNTRISRIACMLTLAISSGAAIHDTAACNDSTSGHRASLTRYEVNPSYLPQFQRTLLGLAASSISDDRNIMFEVYREQDDSLVMWVIERWESGMMQAGVLKSPASATLNRLIEAALSAPPTTIRVIDTEPISRQDWRRPAAAGDQPLTVMLFVDAKPGTEKTFLKLYHIAMPSFRAEPGVITYQLSQFQDDVTRFVTFEKFRSDEAFQYHLKFPPVIPIIEYLNTSIKTQPFQSGLHRLIRIASAGQN